MERKKTVAPSNRKYSVGHETFGLLGAVNEMKKVIFGVKTPSLTNPKSKNSAHNIFTISYM